jgi:hypothetical protein
VECKWPFGGSVPSVPGANLRGSGLRENEKCLFQPANQIKPRLRRRPYERTSPLRPDR